MKRQYLFSEDRREGENKYHVKPVLRWISKREQNTNFCIVWNKRYCRVDLHDIIAMWYTALFQIKAIFWPNKKGWFCGLDGVYFGNERI